MHGGLWLKELISCRIRCRSPFHAIGAGLHPPERSFDPSILRRCQVRHLRAARPSWSSTVGGLLSSDGGVLALREVRRCLPVADRLVGCLLWPLTSSVWSQSLGWDRRRSAGGATAERRIGRSPVNSTPPSPLH